MFLVLLNSGFPLFYNNDKLFILFHLAVLFYTAAVLYINRFKIEMRASFRILFYATLFGALFIAQYAYFGIFNLHKLAVVLIQFMTALLVLSFLSKEFWEIYVDVISILCFVSLLFYFVSFIPAVESFLLDISFVHPNSTLSGKPLRNLVLYNFNFGGVEDIYKRNSGPFWEPGAFAGYIVIALYTNYFILVKKSKRTVLLILTLFTTFSTMGLTAFIFLIFSKYGRSFSFKQVIVFAAIGSLILFAPKEITFEKISKKADLTTGKYETKTRLASAYLDLIDLIDYPVFGRGFVDETRYDGSVKFNNRNCGLTDQIVRLGIPFGLLYFYFYYALFKGSSPRRNSRIYGLIGLVVILIIGFSEMYFRFLFFWILNLKGILHVWNSRYSGQFSAKY
ncbi:MAG TPA: hypothetical protein DCR48_03870 [Flavobacteriales bacterium]|nr:hypothetical protein [Flavobacteriales bacterium]